MGDIQYLRVCTPKLIDYIVYMVRAKEYLSYKPRGLDMGNVEGKKDGCEGLRVCPGFLIPILDTLYELMQYVNRHSCQPTPYFFRKPIYNSLLAQSSNEMWRLHSLSSHIPWQP